MNSPGAGSVRTGLMLISVLAILSVYVIIFSQSDPVRQDHSQTLEGPSVDHLFGTDSLGRDLFSRTMYATGTSLALGCSITTLTVLLGSLLAMVTAYFRGWFDEILMRIIDCMMAFPFLLLAICIASLMHPGWESVVLSLVIAGTPNVTRVIRGRSLSVSNAAYVTACRASGGSAARIILKHIFPNILSTVIIVFSIRVGSVILSEAALSFLGLGIQPPAPTLGGLIQRGSDYIFDAPWWPVIPGFVLAWIVFSLNLLGDGLRDRFDPRTNLN